MSYKASAMAATLDIPATLKLVLRFISDCCNSKTGKCCPSYQTIADGCNLSKRCVIESVNKLVALKLIKRIKKVIKNGLNLVNHYILLFFYGSGERDALGSERGALKYIKEQSNVVVDEAALPEQKENDGYPEQITPEQKKSIKHKLKKLKYPQFTQEMLVYLAWCISQGIIKKCPQAYFQGIINEVNETGEFDGEKYKNKVKKSNYGSSRREIVEDNRPRPPLYESKGSKKRSPEQIEAGLKNARNLKLGLT